MISSWFDLDSTSKTLNLSLLRFNERSRSENLDYRTIYIYIYRILSEKYFSIWCNILKSPHYKSESYNAYKQYYNLYTLKKKKTLNIHEYIPKYHKIQHKTCSYLEYATLATKFGFSTPRAYKLQEPNLQ